MAMCSTIYFGIIILIPVLGYFINYLFFKESFLRGAQIATISVWIGFLLGCIAWTLGWPFSQKVNCAGFIANEISWLMATLILFVSAIVHQFSFRYLAGDRNYRRYFLSITAITVSTLVMIASDNLIFLSVFWLITNFMLVLLMMHKSEWIAAKNSGFLACKTFIWGFIFLSLGAGLLAYDAGTFSLHLILKEHPHSFSYFRIYGLVFIILAAFTQSGIWPFHRWLISSLNSPTPVSALMHAGLVNGGGLLLVRFAVLFLKQEILLDFLFVAGVFTLILGGIWKLIQSNIKRMLACSTMTQMGFMIMQCGLGLFSAALAHICWHGLFKSFLFLRAGAASHEKKHLSEERASKISTFFIAAVIGSLGAFGFVFASHFPFVFRETTTILILFAWMATTQIAHAILQKKQDFFLLVISSVVCLIMGLIYGTTIALIEQVVEPLSISQPQILHSMHIVGILCVFCIWLAMNLKSFINQESHVWWRRFYVRMLNSSQPASNTITSTKQGYKF